MTKDEFGIPFFETIKAIGGLLAIQDQHNAAVYSGDPNGKTDYQNRKAVLVKAFADNYEQLSQQDQYEVLQRYPHVGQLLGA